MTLTRHGISDLLANLPFAFAGIVLAHVSFFLFIVVMDFSNINFGGTTAMIILFPHSVLFFQSIDEKTLLALPPQLSLAGFMLFPFYGAVLGIGWRRKRFRRYLLVVGAIHIVLMFLAWMVSDGLSL